MNRIGTMCLLCLLGLLGAARPAGAADHRDGPALQRDPSTDINDLYAWSDSARVYLAMTLFPAAGREAKFSNAAYYVFHTTSRATFAAAMSAPVDIICGFDAGQRISCWAGTDPADHVSGDGRSPVGLRSTNGRLRVFAGLRRDPFFFNQEGFETVAERIRAGAGAMVFDAANCPALTPAQARALRDGLQQDRSGKPGKDAFLGAGTLALVLSVDKALLTRGGPILSVWAATHPRSN